MSREDTFSPPIQEAANGAGPATAIEAEISVLGACLIDEEAIGRVAGFLEPGSFYREAHRLLFGAMLRLHQRGDIVEPTQVSEELKLRGELDQVGGLPVLAELLDAVPTAANVEFHARTVAERARRRRLVGLVHDVQAEALNPERDVSAITADLRTRLDQFDRGNTAARSRLIDDVALRDLPKPEQLIDGIMPAGGLGVVYGAPGSGKTFVVLDWALCVATGFRWQDHAVRRGPVVMVSAEGSSGLRQRVEAWTHARGHAGRAGVHFLLDPVNLLDAGDVARFVASDLRALDEPPALVIFDTLARCMIGGDENSAEDMGLAIAAADRIRAATGALVLLVHHTNKGGDFERGSTALRGAADTMASVKDEDGVITLRCEKQKDSEPFSPFHLRLARTLESCTIQGATGPLHQATEDLTPSQRQALDELHRLAPSHGFSASKWEDLSGLKRRTFYHAIKALTETGYVQTDKEGRGALYTLTDRGLEAVGAKVQVSATEGATAAGGQCNGGPPPVGGTAHCTDGTEDGQDSCPALSGHDLDSEEASYSCLNPECEHQVGRAGIPCPDCYGDGWREGQPAPGGADG